MTAHRTLIPALAIVAGLACTTPLQAQWPNDGWGSGSRHGNSQYGDDYRYRGYGAEAGYDRGYNDGLNKGRDDGHDGDRFDPRHHRWYRDADRGYSRHYGSRGQYEQAYRSGFLRGYNEGYRREDSRGHRQNGWDWRY